MRESDLHSQHWQDYWRSQDLEHGPPSLWEVGPELSLHGDRLAMEPHFDPALPVIDLGCGSGTLTFPLAERFARVIGVDVAEAAIAHCRRVNDAPNVEFRVLDLKDLEQVERLHDELGDANLYLRTVLHTIPPDGHAEVAQALQRLMGARGAVYVIELVGGVIDFFMGIVNEHGMPPALARALDTGARPGQWPEEELDRFFSPPAFEVLVRERATIHSVHILPTGERMLVPAYRRLYRCAS